MSLRIGIDARFLGHPRLGGYQTYIQELVAAFRRNPPNHDLWLILSNSLPLSADSLPLVGRVREGEKLPLSADSLPLVGRDREGEELPLSADSLPLVGPRSADSLPLEGRVREGEELPLLAVRRAREGEELPLLAVGRAREGEKLPNSAGSLPLVGPRSADSLPLVGRDREGVELPLLAGATAREGVPTSIHTIVQPIHIPFAGVAWREQVAIPRLARKLRFDVMHFPCNTMPSRLTTPAVATVHDTIGLDNRHPTRGLRQALIRRYEHFGIRNTLRRASMVITPSSAVASDLSRAGVPSSRVRTVHSGIRSSMRPAPAAAVEQFKRAHHLRRPYLLALASADPRKNVETAIAALATLESTGLDLVIVMSNPLLQPRLQRVAAGLGVTDRVRFLPALSDDQLAVCYTGATATLFLSLDEGFGMPPLESMACGTPVICSDRPPMSQLYGDSVLLSDPTDARSVASAINRLNGDGNLRRALVQQGCRRAAQFSWDRAATQTLAVYEEAVAC